MSNKPTTLRDLFAREALGAYVLASMTSESGATAVSSAADEYGISSVEAIARASYEFADAMLAARERRTEQ